jgi:hypothetical protein
MASVVLDNSQFPVSQQNVLVADGLKLGGAGFSTTGAISTGNATITSEVTILQGSLSGNGVAVKSIQLDANPASLNGVLDERVSADGTNWNSRTFFQGGDYQQLNCQVPPWSPTVNYNQAFGMNDNLVVYGANTNPAGLYPNNIFYVSGGDGIAVVGVPPTLTPAPYPANGGTPSAPTGGPVPTTGWVLCNSALNEGRFGGGPPSVVDGNGNCPISVAYVGSFLPANISFFGGGGASVGANDLRGVTVSQAPATTAQSLNGATINVAGVVNVDGIGFQRTDQSISPASSYFAFNNATPQARIQFELGNNYTWTQQVAPGTLWGWASAVGTAGTSTITGGANAAFDPDCLVFLQTELEPVLGAHPKGVLSVQAKSNTAIVIHSINPATNAIEPTDVSFFQWMVMNPRWDT